MDFSSVNADDRALIDKTMAAGQQHVFRFWDELTPQQRDRLLGQLRQVDFDLMAQLTGKYLRQAGNALASDVLEPADFIALPKTAEEQRQFDLAKQTGEQALRQGRVAAFLVAGGQGSRLGFDGPKGMFPVSPVQSKTLFQLHAEKLRALMQKFDVTIPWYIMTSESNHAASVAFFEQNDYFGLSPEDVMFFMQAMIPALDPEGRFFLEDKDTIFRNPNGHGGSLSALKKNGALDDMARRGIDLVFYFQVDNVLINICDPVFLGFHIQEQAEMSAKIVTKTDPEEKVGVLGKRNGRLGVIEYSDLPTEEMHARNPDGSLKFRAGSIAIHVFNREFIERENAGGLQLPWHLAHKKIPHVNAQGERVDPAEPNGYKFETFVFDALGDARKAVFLEVKREEEFSPVKNAEGTDSVFTAQRDLCDLFARWLHAAGVEVPRDAEGHPAIKIEISPLFALDEAELAAKVDSDLKVHDGLYLG